jgi:hypothetical protein
MAPAYIQHGKALAAERILTNPPTGTDMGLIGEYVKGEFKGRPIQGNYRLRVWADPGLQWTQLDDIQLMLDYHYWTRFQ